MVPQEQRKVLYTLRYHWATVYTENIVHIVNKVNNVDVVNAVNYVNSVSTQSEGWVSNQRIPKKSRQTGRFSGRLTETTEKREEKNRYTR